MAAKQTDTKLRKAAVKFIAGEVERTGNTPIEVIERAVRYRMQRDNGNQSASQAKAKRR